MFEYNRTSTLQSSAHVGGCHFRMTNITAALLCIRSTYTFNKRYEQLHVRISGVIKILRCPKLGKILVKTNRCV